MMLFLSDGSEIPASTLMEILLMNDFKLVINKITYDVQCPRKGKRHSYATVFTFPFGCGTFTGSKLKNLLNSPDDQEDFGEPMFKLFERGMNDQ